MLFVLAEPDDRPDVFTACLDHHHVRPWLRRRGRVHVAFQGNAVGLRGEWRLVLARRLRARRHVLPSYMRQLNAGMPQLAAVAALAVLLARIGAGNGPMVRWRQPASVRRLRLHHRLGQRRAARRRCRLWSSSFARAAPVRRRAPAGALPWVIAHHVLHFAHRSRLDAAHMVPEYVEWPGAPSIART